MALIVRHCREKKMSATQMKSVLEMVHPILMENISVSSDGKLLVRDKKLIWIRRQCWAEGKTSDLYTN